MLFPQQLPFELLALVADFIDPQEHGETIYVNRTWNRVFGRKCFRHVTIGTRCNARRFFHCLEQSSRHGRPIGMFVKELHFAKAIGIGPNELEQLPRHVPNLEVLDFKDGMWRWVGVPRSWAQFRKLQKVPEARTWYRTLSLVCTVGRSLRQLKLGNMILEGENTWIALLAFTPQLERLELYSQFQPGDEDEDEDEGARSTHLTYTQLRGVLGLLPRLRSLELRNLALLMSDHERRLACDCDRPYPRLQQLTVQSQLDNCHWLVYFTTRFPNIERLRLDLSWREPALSDTADTDVVAAKQALLAFAAAQHRRLHELALTDITPWCRFPAYSELFGAMRAAGNRPHTLNYLRFHPSGDGDDNSNDRNDDEDYFYAMLDTLHPDTTRVQAFTWEGLDDIHPAILVPLRDSFSRLTSLNLKCMGLVGDCPLDLVLDCCPSLKRLALANARATLRHGTRERRFPLTHLRLCEMGFSTDVMDHVGHCCRELRELHIQMCNKTFKEDDGGRVVIDMPHQALDRIIIEVLGLDPGWTPPQVHLYPMAFFSLTRLDHNRQWIDRRRRRRQQQEEEEEQLNIGDPEAMVSDLTRWYHLYDVFSEFSVSGIDTRRAQQLSSVQGREIMSYSMTSSDWKCIGDHHHVRWVFKKKKDWRRDLYLGYTNIRCRSVKLLHIDGVDIRF